MESYNLKTPAIQVTNSASALGSSTSYANVFKGYQKCDVINGNVKGNRKKPNPFSFQIWRNYFSPSVFHENAYYFGSGAYTHVDGYDSPSNAMTSSGSGYNVTWDTNRTLDGAMAKVYDSLRGNSNLIVDLAESAATIKMLRSIFSLRKTASNFFQNVVKKRAYKRIRPGPTQGQKRLDYVTSKWLEYRYGWMPLMYSIYDAIDTLNMDINNRSLTVVKRSSYKTQTDGIALDGTGSYDSPLRRLKYQSVSVRTEVGFVFQRPPGYMMADWTSMNPLAIAWELTPLSFVADWFVNVSEVLDSWENFILFNSAFKGGYITDTCKTDEQYEAYGYSTYVRPPMADGVRSRYYFASGKRVITKKDRRVVSTLPISASIRVKVNVNQKRALDGLALLTQIFVKNSRVH